MVGAGVGEVCADQIVVVLIGDRQGLVSPDSMGIHSALGPRSGMTDETRNCISNVRVEGLRYDLAVHKLLYLMTVEGLVRESGGARFVVGNHVVLDHGEGVFSLYAHLQRDSLTVAVGDVVAAGDRLRLGGDSGKSRGPHPVSYTHLPAHETVLAIVFRLLP